MREWIQKRPVSCRTAPARRDTALLLANSTGRDGAWPRIYGAAGLLRLGDGSHLHRNPDCFSIAAGDLLSPNFGDGLLGERYRRAVARAGCSHWIYRSFQRMALSRHAGRMAAGCRGESGGLARSIRTQLARGRSAGLARVRLLSGCALAA